MIDTAVILAAGKGERFREESNIRSKPLAEIFGVSLIERNIYMLKEYLSVKKIIVITGFNHQELENHLNKIKQRRNLDIKAIYDQDWEKGNGHTFLTGLNNTSAERFYLQMSDHLFTDDFYEKIKNSIIDQDKSYLITSKSLSYFHDLQDATKVKIKNDTIKEINKSITHASGYDTGFFIINKLNYKNFDGSKLEKIEFSNINQFVADKNFLKPIFVNENSWMDVDNKSELEKSKEFLIEGLKSKKTDGSASKHINRKISALISKKLVNYEITPNQISIFAFIVALVGAYLISKNNYLLMVLGGVFAQLSSVIDGCDGEIARLKLLNSKFGGWFDQVLDRYSDIFILSGLTINCFNTYQSNFVLFVGLLAVGSKVLLSYTAYKYDEIIKGQDVFRIGRDLTTLILLIGLILNFPYFTLVILTIIFNFEIIKRIIILKDKFI